MCMLVGGARRQHGSHTLTPLTCILSPNEQGYELAKKDLLAFLDTFKEEADPKDR